MAEINLVGQTILGYTVIEKINSGTFGTVYKVEKNNPAGRYVRALKHIRIPTEKQYASVLNSMGGDVSKADNYFTEKLKEIISEINILNELSEKGVEHIVRYYENDIHVKDSPRRYDVYILMEYLTPLDDYIVAHTVTVRDVVTLGKDILTGLKACHENGIIHRDIKDDNIFVSESGGYKIGDFGVSKVLKDSTKAESLKGTPNYLAPEVYLGKAGYTVSVDLYSLGIVLYRLLNYGRNPFLPPFPEQFFSQDEDKAFEARMSGSIPKYPLMGGEEIGAVIVKSIADSENRYQSAEEFLKDLEVAVLRTEDQLLEKTINFNSESITSDKKEDKQEYRETIGESHEPILDNPSTGANEEGPSINKHLFDSIGEQRISPNKQVSEEHIEEQEKGNEDGSRERPSDNHIHRVVTPPPKVEDPLTPEPIDKNVVSKAVFAAPFILLLIGAIAYFIIIPSIYGQVVSFIDWLISDPENIIETLRDPNAAFGKANYIIAIRIFWYIWLSGFIASLYFVGRQFQKKPEPNAVDALLVKKEPYLMAQDIVAALKEVALTNKDVELKKFISSVKRLEERLSVESDFGYGKPSVINCENEIARQLQYILESVPYITSGDMSANIMELNKALTNINSLLRKRTELKKR